MMTNRDDLIMTGVGPASIFVYAGPERTRLPDSTSHLGDALAFKRLRLPLISLPCCRHRFHLTALLPCFAE